MKRWAIRISSTIAACIVVSMTYAAALAPAEAQRLEGRYPQLANPPMQQSARFVVDPRAKRSRASDEIEARYEIARAEVLRLNVELRSKQTNLEAAQTVVTERSAALAEAESNHQRLKQQMFDLLQNSQAMPNAQREPLFQVPLLDLATANERLTRARRALDAAIEDRDDVQEEVNDARSDLEEAQGDENDIVEERSEWLTDLSGTYPDRSGIMIERDAIIIRFKPESTAAAIDAALTSFRSHGVRVRSGAAAIGLIFTELTPPTPGDDRAVLNRMNDVMNKIREHPLVQWTYENVVLGSTGIPAPSASAVVGYNWFGPGTGPDGTLAARLLRFPEAWNFGDAIKLRGNQVVPVGVIDTGFTDHEDLSTATHTIICSTHVPADDHGNHVMGIISADFDNGRGVDGGTPFAHVTACAPPPAVSYTGTGTERALHVRSAPFDKIVDAVKALAGTRVINVSLGYRWVEACGIEFDPDIAAPTRITERIQAIVRRQGQDVRDLLRTAPYSDIIVVSAAGNDCNQHDCQRQARWTSPFNWAAHGDSSVSNPAAENVIVVQGNRSNDRNERLAKSNVGGTVAAPGEDVVSTSLNNGYASHLGTSMAAPQITAIVALMLAYNDSLTPADVHRILKTSTTAPPTPNAFSALVESSPATFAGDLADIAPVNAPDGRVDMEDFNEFARRLKDYARAMASGAKDFRIDQNGDRVANQFDELYPRADFNGDGRVSETATNPVPTLGTHVTDLDVLMSAWQDPVVPKWQLPLRLATFPDPPPGL